MIRSAVQRVQGFRFAREALLIGGAYMAYEIVRSLSAGQVLDAFENAHLVVRVEQALGIFAELELQVAALGYSALVQALSLWYFWGHFPLILLFAIWLFYRHHDSYRWARTAIFLSGGIALVLYLTFPVAPPRLIPGGGFVDTVKGVYALQYDSSSLVNQYAAVPSMHQGFALIMGWSLYRVIGGRTGLLLVGLLPAIMLASIIVTGNHWILDAVLGIAVAIIGMTLASMIERHGDRFWSALRGRLSPHLPPRLQGT